MLRRCNYKGWVNSSSVGGSKIIGGDTNTSGEGACPAVVYNSRPFASYSDSNLNVWQQGLVLVISCAQNPTKVAPSSRSARIRVL